MDTSKLSSTVFYTRFGLGVSDTQWLDFRLALFQAVTLPSISRFCAHGAQWVVFTDTRLPPAQDNSLRHAVHRAPGSVNIRIEPLDMMVQMRPRMESLVADRDLVTLVKIDDDDALSDDFFDLMPREPGLVTLPHGFEVIWADQVHRPKTHPFLSMNTAATLPPHLVRDFVRVSHSAVGKWARAQGLPVSVLDEAPPTYVYGRHPLADTGYADHRRAVMEDPQKADFTRRQIRRFGIDRRALSEWSQLARRTPGLKQAKTWELSHALNRASLEHLDQVEALHQQIWESTSELLQGD
ncbi:glycosyltransferase [Citricoccus nitrophenolicus]|uniref:glycosyltransferase n=1 Tax=Citricoccus nitrophenolicus TaxID=863575 RepID=UPI0031EBC811